jgi:hypothetical protein
MAFFFLTSAIQIYQQRKNNKELFSLAKKNAYIGISLGVIIWLIGFTVVGGEWFSMWQSNDWNGLEPADRIISFFMFTYLALVVVD